MEIPSSALFAAVRYTDDALVPGCPKSSLKMCLFVKHAREIVKTVIILKTRI